ncbi:TonB-dependent receptor [Paraflavitalea sp. CAU 1676]|uniref:TonB-dependent receptor plug domain-containing protein n=1 Tax=Paraflavitalea sp. CAU 1676 TaxID=3032598 RepID=UPI0023DA4ACA|nr:TonB-dependent receptor [Paraflavitalea sp. CAU 1676]MDF2187195.1 TonB-dependent receptor [Paraflavitalea sp. CAU 1676]
MIKRLLSLTALLAALYSQAQDSTAARAMDEVVVTATKYPKKTSETGKVITVISRAQLDRSAGKDLSQLLNEQAGISVNGANSNPGKDKAVYLRGAKSDYTLIMVDGAPVYDATGSSSNFDLRMMPIDNIERIEILKGSQSTLYGSDAVAGVINIITRQGGGKQVASPYATVSYGSYETRKVNAGVNGSVDRFSYNVGFTHLKTAGISEATDAGNTGKFDKDGYEQNSILANFGVKVSHAVKISPFFRYSKFNSQLDANAFADDKDYSFNQQNIQGGLRSEVSLGRAKLNLLYNLTYTERNYLNDSTIKESIFDGYSTGYYKGNEHFLDAYIHTPLAENLTFTGGVDYRNGITDVKTAGVYKYEMGGVIYNGEYASTISTDSAKQHQVGVYGALTYNRRGFNVEAGGRFNNHSVYGSNGVFSFNPSYLINRQFKVFANISSAYKVPTLYQLYSEYKNPFTDLSPEKAITYEGGVQYASTNNLINARVAVFKRNVRDAIVFYTNPNTFASYYINQDKQKDWGFEIEPTINIKEKVKLILSWAHVDGEVTTKTGAKDTTYFNLARRPKDIFSATVNYHVIKGLFVSAGVQSFGKRTDLDFSTYPTSIAKLKAYTLVNFYAEYQVIKAIKVFADVKNLANTSYVEVLGYNTLGRNFNAGISVRL